MSNLQHSNSTNVIFFLFVISSSAVDSLNEL
ncbi:hypothetical protein AZE42_11496, partial [Rhizopogon vesiculosus]